MKKLLLIAASALALAVGSVAADAAKLKACWVYTGPIGDFGYSFQHDQGRLAAQKALGDKIETTYLENITEGPDAERAFERLARENCGIIFGTSFGFMDPELKVAKKYPNIKFEHATGFKTADNMAVYNARFYEGRYVLGQIAAKTSKTGVAGYIVSFPIPEVVMGIDSFLLGAQSVNPNFKLKIVWVNTWFDPGKEADAAKALFDQGADIIVQHTDSTAPLQVAEERHMHGFGQSSDQIKFAPHAQYTAIVDNWGPYYISRLKAVLDGTWKTSDTWDGIKQGTVTLAPYTNLPDDVVAMAKATEDKISSGWNPFTGPIYDQAGTLKIKPGEVIADKDLLGLNWYVKGIDDKLPQ